MIYISKGVNHPKVNIIIPVWRLDISEGLIFLINWYQMDGLNIPKDFISNKNIKPCGWIPRW